MRTIEEITAEINRAKAMASCGKDYKRFLESHYMQELRRELAAAQQQEIDRAYVAACVEAADEAAAKANENFTASDRCLSKAEMIYSRFYSHSAAYADYEIYDERISLAHKAMCEYLNIEAE